MYMTAMPNSDLSLHAVKPGRQKNTMVVATYFRGRGKNYA